MFKRQFFITKFKFYAVKLKNYLAKMFLLFLQRKTSKYNGYIFKNFYKIFFMSKILNLFIDIS